MGLSVIAVKKEVTDRIENIFDLQVMDGNSIATNSEGRKVLFLGLELRKKMTHHAVMKIALADNGEEKELFFREFEKSIIDKAWGRFVLSLKGLSYTHLSQLGRDMMVYEISLSFL